MNVSGVLFEPFASCGISGMFIPFPPMPGTQSGWSQAWEGIKSIFSGVWDGILSICKGVINGITGAVNVVIRGLNSLKVPDWVPGIGGKGINIPEIPVCPAQ